MSAIGKSAQAVVYEWETNPNCPEDGIDKKDALALSRAAVLAFLEGVDPQKLGGIIRDYIEDGGAMAVPRSPEGAAGIVLAALRAEAIR